MVKGRLQLSSMRWVKLTEKLLPILDLPGSNPYVNALVSKCNKAMVFKARAQIFVIAPGDLYFVFFLQSWTLRGRWEAFQALIRDRLTLSHVEDRKIHICKRKQPLLRSEKSVWYPSDVISTTTRALKIAMRLQPLLLERKRLCIWRDRVPHAPSTRPYSVAALILAGFLSALMNSETEKSHVRMSTSSGFPKLATMIDLWKAARVYWEGEEIFAKTSWETEKRDWMERGEKGAEAGEMEDCWKVNALKLRRKGGDEYQVYSENSPSVGREKSLER